MNRLLSRHFGEIASMSEDLRLLNSRLSPGTVGN